MPLSYQIPFTSLKPVKSLLQYLTLFKPCYFLSFRPFWLGIVSKLSCEHAINSSFSRAVSYQETKYRNKVKSKGRLRHWRITLSIL